MDSVCGAPNEAALLQLMERTGYHMLQENGQRKYGPPPDWTSAPPPRGCEIFVGKIPRDCYEDELVPVFERCGKIYEFRLMMDFSGSNRGYCFVTYTSREDARRAVAELNNHEIRRGRFLGVCMSVDNCRLFVGGIPKHKQQEEILEEMKKVTEGVIDVIVYPSPSDKTKNRGFAFVEYASHRAAAMARRKLIPGRIQLWGHQIAVDWAEPEQEVDDDIMSKVKILYVRNLMLSTPEETLEYLFNQAAGHDGAVERVKKLRDYAFIHFYERDDALRALSVINGSNIDGSTVEVVLAKPVDKNSYMRYTRNSGKVTPTITNQSQQTAAYTYPATLDQQLQYLSLTSPTNTAARGSVSVDDFITRNLNAMPPMMLPRMPLRGRCYSPVPITASNSDTTARTTADFGAPGTGFSRHSFRKPGETERLYDIVPGMELTPAYAGQQHRQQCKAPVQMLEELCLMNNWGSPTYELNSTLSYDGSGDVQLFAFKIYIPGLKLVYVPPKLSQSIERAQIIAAEHTLHELRVAIEGGDASIAAAASLMMLYGGNETVHHSALNGLPGVNGGLPGVNGGLPGVNGGLPGINGLTAMSGVGMSLAGTTSLTDMHSHYTTNSQQQQQQHTVSQPAAAAAAGLAFYKQQQQQPTVGGSSGNATFQF